MDIFLKAGAGVLITLVLCLILAKQGKDYSLLLTVAVCCMIATAAINYLNPVIDFFRNLQSLGKLDGEMLGIILKTIGIGLLGEITALICADAGNTALGKTLQILASTVILAISVPLFKSLIELLEEILVAI